MNLNNVKLNLDTELVYNVGCPIAKTNAPRVYNKLFEQLNMNAIMLPVEIKKGELADFMQACKVLDVRYFSPTMPHKADIIPFLDDVDETSRLFQSVNTVRIDENGISHGSGMDGKGAVKAMIKGDAKLDGVSALIYGAGSISGVIGYELSRQNVKKLYIANRSKEKANAIGKILNDNTPLEVEVISTEPDELDRAAQECELMANLTPLGMKGYQYKHDYLGFINKMPKTSTVFDCVINPPQTEVIKTAEENGLNTVSGMQMLVNQMDVIFDFMFNVQLTESNKEACIAELIDFLNVKK